MGHSAEPNMQAETKKDPGITCEEAIAEALRAYTAQTGRHITGIQLTDYGDGNYCVGIEDREWRT